VTALLASSRPQARPRPRGTSRWVRPVAARYPIGSGYGATGGGLWPTGHSGVDFPAPEGTPIVAVAAGRAVFVGVSGNCGTMVKIQHAPGFETLYCHMSRTGVAQGAQVTAGQTIGYVGATGRVTGNHLHLGLQIDGVTRDPTPYLTGAAEAPSSPTYDTGAQQVGVPTNAAAVDDAADGLRSLAIVGAVIAGGLGLVVLGSARAVTPRRPA